MLVFLLISTTSRLLGCSTVSLYLDSGCEILMFSDTSTPSLNISILIQISENTVNPLILTILTLFNYFSIKKIAKLKGHQYYMLYIYIHVIQNHQKRLSKISIHLPLTFTNIK